MTKDEKFAVIRAHLDGEPIQVKNKDSTIWRDTTMPNWDFTNCKYRVKPEPLIDYSVVKEHVLYALRQGQLHPATVSQNDMMANIIEEMSKLGLVDYHSAMDALLSKESEVQDAKDADYWCRAYNQMKAEKDRLHAALVKANDGWGETAKHLSITETLLEKYEKAASVFVNAVKHDLPR